jgi:hypothetical protein
VSYLLRIGPIERKVLGMAQRWERARRWCGKMHEARPVRNSRRAIRKEDVMVTDVQVEELERTLQEDPEFKASFDADPVVAVRSRGMDDIGGQFEAWLADQSKLEAELPDIEAHGLSDKLNEKLATKPRLALLLVSSAVIASHLGGIKVKI